MSAASDTARTRCAAVDAAARASVTNPFFSIWSDSFRNGLNQAPNTGLYRPEPVFWPGFWHSGRYRHSGPVSKNEGIEVLKTKKKKIRREIHSLNEEACVDDDSLVPKLLYHFQSVN